MLKCTTKQKNDRQKCQKEAEDHKKIESDNRVLTEILIAVQALNHQKPISENQTKWERFITRVNDVITSTTETAKAVENATNENF